MLYLPALSLMCTRPFPAKYNYNFIIAYLSTLCNAPVYFAWIFINSALSLEYIIFWLLYRPK